MRDRLQPKTAADGEDVTNTPLQLYPNMVGGSTFQPVDGDASNWIV